MFFSKNQNSAKLNYKINDKKLHVIIYCFEQWRLEIEDIGVPIKVTINYKILKYFMITKKLIRYQACWAEFLSKFYYITSYTLNKNNTKADALT